MVKEKERKKNMDREVWLNRNIERYSVQGAGPDGIAEEEPSVFYLLRGKVNLSHPVQDARGETVIFFFFPGDRGGEGGLLEVVQHWFILWA